MAMTPQRIRTTDGFGYPIRESRITRLPHGTALPCARPAGPGIVCAPQFGVDVETHLDQPSHQPEKIREPVEISQHIGIDWTLQREPHSQSLGASAHRSR